MDHIVAEETKGQNDVIEDDLFDAFFKPVFFLVCFRCQKQDDDTLRFDIAEKTTNALKLTFQ